ncbi:MAG: hypothetical protein ACOC2H_05560 [Spirochaetota bacterium]
MRRILLIVTIIIFLRPLLAQDAIFPDDEVRTYSGPDISGSLENSTTLGSDEGSASFADIIELELILERRYDNWEIHTDTVLSAYYLSGDETPDDYDAKIHRAYFRIFEDNVIMSAGKLFINQGVAGIFNPFLVDQTVSIPIYTRTATAFWRWISSFQRGRSRRWNCTLPMTGSVIPTGPVLNRRQTSERLIRVSS